MKGKDYHMTINDVQTILHGSFICGEEHAEREIHSACGSDMMSDVLAYVKDQAVLLTGLCNPQVIRTAEMIDIYCIVFIRGKKPTPCLFRECSDRMMFGRYERLMYFDVVGSFRESGYMLKNYGVKWRCWNTKPSEDQRRATPWSR